MKNRMSIKISFVVVLSVFVISAAIFLLFRLYFEEQKIHEKWAQQSYHNVEVMSNLQDLKAYFGYGGFIHYFKNYILRKDSAYLVKMRNAGSNIEMVLDDLDQVIHQSDLPSRPELVNAVSVLRETYFKYVAHSEEARKFIAQGLSVSEIDRRVRIDDVRAIQALELLDMLAIEYQQDVLNDVQIELGHLNELARFAVILVPLIILMAVMLVRSMLKMERTGLQARTAHESLQRLMQAVPDALVVVDREGNIQQFNAAAPSLFGYTSEQFAYIQLEGLLPPELRASHVGLRKGFFDLPRNRRMASRLNLLAWHADGHRFPVDVSLSFMQEGENVYAVALLYDISERVLFERSKDEFVSIMAHELKTPVTALNGALGMIQQADQLSDEQRAQLLDVSLRNGERLATLVQDMLDMREIIAGELHVSLDDISLKAAVDSAVRRYAGLAREKKISLQADMKGADELLRGDAIKIRKVVHELVENAIKFSDRGSVINIETGVEGANVTCSISSEGETIPPDKVSAIFKRFEQLDSADSRSYGGAGLGLYICHAYLEAMHGSIEVSSDNRITRFTCYLPRAKDARRQAG